MPVSEELDSASHFLGARQPCQHHEVQNNLPKTPMLGWPEDDARMCSACGGQHKEITVACHENATLRESISKLLDPKRRQALDRALSYHRCRAA
jgi:hypothetical protein